MASPPRGHDSWLLELLRTLQPRIVRRSSQETGAHYDDFVDWPAGATLDNVAYAFARLVGLPHDAWLQWRDDLSDAQDWKQHGAVKVGADDARSLSTDP